MIGKPIARSAKTNIDTNKRACALYNDEKILCSYNYVIIMFLENHSLFHIQTCMCIIIIHIIQ